MSASPPSGPPNRPPITQIITSIVTPPSTGGAGDSPTPIVVTVTSYFGPPPGFTPPPGFVPPWLRSWSSSPSTDPTLATSIVSSSSSPSPVPAAQSSSKDSSALKIGLGVGLSLGLTLIIALSVIAFLLLRRRRRKQPSPETQPEDDIKPAVIYAHNGQQPQTYHEMDDKPVLELEAPGPAPVEINTRGHSVKEKKEQRENLAELGA